MAMIDFGDHSDEDRMLLVLYLAGKEPRFRARVGDYVAMVLSVGMLAAQLALVLAD